MISQAKQKTAATERKSGLGKPKAAAKKSLAARARNASPPKTNKPARPNKAAKTTKPVAAKRKPAKSKVKRSELSEEPPQSKTYMSLKQRSWFRKKLETMLEEIQHEAEQTAKVLREQEKVHADEFDRANSEFAFVVDLRENERISNLQIKINHGLRQLDEATYGYCDDCKVEIGIERMTARPVATKCIDCKQFQENLEKHSL